MERKERIQQIRDAITATTTNDASAFHAGDAVAEVRGANGIITVDSSHDIQFLLSEVDRLQAANEAMANINRELIQEIENVKADFGGTQR